MSQVLLLVPFALQGLALGVDELVCHRRRQVPRWEWVGHVLDSAVFLAALAVPAFSAPAPTAIRLFGLLAVASCLLITKDEFVHQRLCSGAEQWLHALLFLLHPMVLMAAAWLWLGAGAAPALVRLQVLLVAAFLGLQLAFGAGRKGGHLPGPAIDNRIYEQLGERWYSASDDPVALLRAEARLRTGWVLAELRAAFGPRPLAILDVACGAGFLANPLAAAGHRVTGIDLSADSLAVARRHDPTGSVAYLAMDALQLDFADGSFDVVCMMDFLEHLEDRDRVIGEAARVLRPGGWLLFHTFNRNPLSGLIAIKGVEWFVRNTPRHLHVYRLFLKPRELRGICARHGLEVEVLRGLRPRLATLAFLRLLATGRVGPDFTFCFSRSLAIGYCGWARKAG